MNPNGVIFGPGAQLDVAGSFAVTTANEMVLADGGKFAAIVDPDANVLTSASPVAFGFLTDNPAAIQVDQANLQVPPGETLAIMAGDVEFTNATINARDGRVVLASAGSNGTVKLDVNDLGSQVEFDPSMKGGNVTASGTLGIEADTTLFIFGVGPSGIAATNRLGPISFNSVGLTLRQLFELLSTFPAPPVEKRPVILDITFSRLETALLPRVEVDLQANCAVQFAGDASSFTIRSPTGLPPQPGGWWPSFQRSAHPREGRYSAKLSRIH